MWAFQLVRDLPVGPLVSGDSVWVASACPGSPSCQLFACRRVRLPVERGISKWFCRHTSQEVCPYNRKFSAEASEAAFAPMERLATPDARKRGQMTHGERESVRPPRQQGRKRPCPVARGHQIQARVDRHVAPPFVVARPRHGPPSPRPADIVRPRNDRALIVHPAAGRSASPRRQFSRCYRLRWIAMAVINRRARARKVGSTTRHIPGEDAAPGRLRSASESVS